MERRALVEENLGLVFEAARSWAERYGVRVEELLGPATEGFLRALETYDPEKGALSTYAFFWMEAYMRRALEVERYVPEAKEVHLSTPVRPHEEEGDTLEDFLPWEGQSPQEVAERALFERKVAEVLEGLPPPLREYASLRAELGPREAGWFLTLPEERVEEYERAFREALAPLREWL